MINIDLTKAFHPSFTDLLAAFLPGLFFEICVLLGNPGYAQRILGSLSADRYVQLFIVLFLAFTLGSVLILWVRFIQIQLTFLYAHIREWRPKILDRRITRAFANPQVAQPGQTPAAPSKKVLKLQAAQSKRVQDQEDLRSAQAAWRAAATQLLKWYGIEVNYPGASWDPWSGVLGADELRAQDKRGYLFVMALHATGWSGLLASYFAPALRVSPFAIFCLFLIGYGLLHDRQLASALNDSGDQWSLALRCVLAELRKVRRENLGLTPPEESDN